MRLGDMLRREHVIVPLRASTVKQATQQLAARLIDTGAVTEPQRLRAVIENAWPEDLVSVGEHAFLPHFRTEAVRALLTAVGIAPTPIPWEKDPNRSARVRRGGRPPRPRGDRAAQPSPGAGRDDEPRHERRARDNLG